MFTAHRSSQCVISAAGRRDYFWRRYDPYLHAGIVERMRELKRTRKNSSSNIKPIRVYN